MATGGLKRMVHRVALAGERALARVFPNPRPDRPVLDPYRGYSAEGGIVLRGRVLASLRRTTPDPTQSRWQNLREMAALFMTDEVSGVRVTAPTYNVSALSDEEGYFSMVVPVEMAAGPHHVLLEIESDPSSRVMAPVQVTGPGATIGVISDIDDTVMQTGAHSLAKNLWTTFTGSALSRHVYPDAVVLLDHLSDHGRNPVFFVSSSPWNLHAFLVSVFDRAGLVFAPLFLRDLGLSESQFITPQGGHGGHKGQAIDQIMSANPGLPFVLIGDTGQHDAHVYLDACHRHGGRIKAVVLREPVPGTSDDDRAAIASIRRLGVPAVVTSDFATVPDAFTRDGVDLGMVSDDP
ncbi:phosphatase domain-containing protein [Palleronia caenipelagi]|uniref:DUF2183 domain-containing protein n=1 Tax=Palleronia caenipelagi TaxID=2489174 RepID=A0A547Q6T6_9RHOB|nr:phosphatase domain-containing protein [Palleronia caenipelagi]TRD22084.1 DUF2183 domain-containing protein [Palleronia caenipelagi]